MDARIDVFRLFGLSEGDAHVIRNAGGSVTDDTLRSLVISQRFLGTREVVLVHHTRCGMLSFNDDELAAELEAETGSRPPWAGGAFSDLAGDLRTSAERVRACPWLPERTKVRAFVFDVDSGGLEEIAV